jgi:hypothetical protein
MPRESALRQTVWLGETCGEDPYGEDNDSHF